MDEMRQLIGRRNGELTPRKTRPVVDVSERVTSPITPVMGSPLRLDGFDKAIEGFVFDVDGKLAQAAENQDTVQGGLREISAKLREVGLLNPLRWLAHKGPHSVPWNTSGSRSSYRASGVSVKWSRTSLRMLPPRRKSCMRYAAKLFCLCKGLTPITSIQAFNEELDSMYNDSQLPDDEAWTALTVDLQQAKQARNNLSKENT